MPMNGRARNHAADWDSRVAWLMAACKIDTTAKMARLPTEVGKQGKVKSKHLNPFAAQSRDRAGHRGVTKGQPKYSRRVDDVCPLVLARPQF